MKDTGQPIYFPALISSGDRLIEITKKDFVDFDLVKHLGGNTYLLKNGCSPQLHASFLIDRFGGWRQLKVIRFRRPLLKYIWWIWDWVLIEYSFERSEQLTSKAMLERLNNLKARPPFAKAGHLRGMLKRLPPDTIFDAKLFREFWDKHCPKLQPHEWEEELP